MEQREQTRTGVRLGDLVERFGGLLAGDPDLVVASIAPLDSAGPNQISFLSNSKLRALAAQSQAAALILSPLDDPSVAATYTGARIVTTIPTLISPAPRSISCRAKKPRRRRASTRAR